MFFCNTRSSMDCISNDIVPILFWNNMPSSVISKSRLAVPVKAPFSCPNSTEGQVPCQYATVDRHERHLYMLAVFVDTLVTDSLSVPLASSISTDISERLTLRTFPLQVSRASTPEQFFLFRTDSRERTKYLFS